MTEEKQAVMAGGLLSKLGDLFFKGLSGILDAAAEYEEEYGVLKQKTVLNLEDKGTGKEYTLTIKLSPVKNKDGYYYVEASTTAPGLDVSSLNEKVIQLNNRTKDDFNRKIEELLEKHNLTKQGDPETPEQNVDEVINQVNKELEDIVIESDNEDDIEYEVKARVEKKDNKLLLTASLSDGSETSEEKTTEIDFLSEEDGSILSVDTIVENAIAAIEDLFRDEEDESGEQETTASTIVKATFIKSSKTNEVSIRAITANVDIEDALDIAYDVADDEVFANNLGDEPQSFEIVESHESYSVNPITSIF